MIGQRRREPDVPEPHDRDIEVERASIGGRWQRSVEQVRSDVECGHHDPPGTGVGSSRASGPESPSVAASDRSSNGARSAGTPRNRSRSCGKPQSACGSASTEDGIRRVRSSATERDAMSGSVMSGSSARAPRWRSRRASHDARDHVVVVVCTIGLSTMVWGIAALCRLAAARAGGHPTPLAIDVLPP